MEAAALYRARIAHIGDRAYAAGELRALDPDQADGMHHLLTPLDPQPHAFLALHDDTRTMRAMISDDAPRWADVLLSLLTAVRLVRGYRLADAPPRRDGWSRYLTIGPPGG